MKENPWFWVSCGLLGLLLIQEILHRCSTWRNDSRNEKRIDDLMDRVQSPTAIELHQRKVLEETRNAPEPEPEKSAEPYLEAFNKSPLSERWGLSELRDNNGVPGYELVNDSGQSERWLSVDQLHDAVKEYL